MKSRDVLVITGIEGWENMAAMLSERLGSRVQVATTRRAGLQSLRRGEFGVVVVEENLVEGDPDWAEQVWTGAGPGDSAAAEFFHPGRRPEVQAALARLEEEHAVAREAVACEMRNELKSSLTGLLLQSELAMREPAGSAALAPKLKKLVELAGDIRNLLDESAARSDRNGISA